MPGFGVPALGVSRLGAAISCLLALVAPPEEVGAVDLEGSQDFLLHLMTAIVRRTGREKSKQQKRGKSGIGRA